jgi:predicted house-cleaning noncanonical NTP pyrophosphatase (MazG superfamily)
MGYKLVRDKQPAFCKKHGISGQWRTSPDIVGALCRKLGEEYGEYAEHHDPAELYDMQDVLDTLIMLSDPYRLHQGKHWEKYARLGGFEDHTEWNPLPPQDGLNEDGDPA